MKIEVEIEEGDKIKLNDKWWSVEEINNHPLESEVIWMTNPINRRDFDKDELQWLISSSGEFRLIKKAYVDVTPTG